MLGSYMEDIQITPQQFSDACSKVKIKTQFQQALFEQVDIFLIQTRQPTLYFQEIPILWGAAIFTTSKNTAAVFLTKSVKKWVCFCQFQFEVYNWQYFILHWQNYTYYTVIFTVHCHFHTYEI